ncbi:hypothetical protein C8F01DRAFT_1276267 [Mycena amicta]|nr:hypothetical protein C8F01DRAFT_1276267 [Mycena amicta]
MEVHNTPGMDSASGESNSGKKSSQCMKSREGYRAYPVTTVPCGRRAAGVSERRSVVVEVKRQVTSSLSPGVLYTALELHHNDIIYPSPLVPCARWTLSGLQVYEVVDGSEFMFQTFNFKENEPAQNQIYVAERIIPNALSTTVALYLLATHLVLKESAVFLKKKWKPGGQPSYTEPIHAQVKKTLLYSASDDGTRPQILQQGPGTGGDLEA